MRVQPRSKNKEKPIMCTLPWIQNNWHMPSVYWVFYGTMYQNKQGIFIGNVHRPIKTKRNKY